MELLEFLYFLLQWGLATTGAAALWGLFLTFRGKGDGHGDECIIYDWLAEKLLIPLYGGVVLAGTTWFVLLFLIPAEAHVGVTLVSTMAEKAHALELMSPFFALWLLISPVGLFVSQFSPKRFHMRLSIFFAVQLIFAIVLIGTTSWSGQFDWRQFFFFSHTSHSILTLGTVIVLDFLFLISKSSLHLKQHIYPLFPTISKAVLIGLGLEILGVLFVFQDAIELTPKFFFMQTVIGILLINGMVLAGPVTRRMLKAISTSDGRLTRKWEIVGEIAGTISITSWFAITFVDFFENLTLSYLGLFSIYAGVLIIAITGHLLWSHFFSPSVPRSYFAWHRGE